MSSADARVYWANLNSGTIGRANLDGSGVSQSFITSPSSPAGVAVDGAHIYWTDLDADAVRRANLDGSGANQNFITGASDPTAVAVDGAHIYWTNLVADTIGRANLDGSGVKQDFITGANDPTGVAVDGAHIYWTNFATNSIGRANLDGSGANQSFVMGTNSPAELALDGTHIYWSNFLGTRIGRANLDGTGVDANFITAGNFPRGVAVDGAHIYWTNYGLASGTTIGRANLDGSGVNQSFITGASAPYGVAVTPLETTITAGPSGTTRSSSATFSFAASEPAGFECSLDGAAFVPCSSPRTYVGLRTGSHSFYARARDASGNVDPTPALRLWRVDRTAPDISAYRLSPRTFRAARRGGSVQATRTRVGTRVGYVLSETASVRFTVRRAAPGRRVRGRCRKPTRTNRGARPCRRYVKLRGEFTQKGKQGANRFKFGGRLRGRRLRPGRYRLYANPTDTAGNEGSSKRAGFRIVRR